MIRIYVIYFICIFEIIQIIENCSARPTTNNNNNNNNNDNQIILNESNENNNSNNLLNNNNLNDNTNLSKRSIVFSSSNNCDKVEHTGKCPDRSKNKKLGATSKTGIELLISTLSTPGEADLKNNDDHPAEALPVISHNMFDITKS
ncbi:putative uncharacterized protein DDB_G0292292 [Condylostylus longicornis]|uniref:putative uncharacterized protein DDB_G0292292 n=1 Tax=Condylostylus longicornis TaxID=2530218 RepID=UPI00244D9F5D|nr:putative uncharacterized protein DDB_G0292292 [Condylostylus longicornis]